MKRRRDLLLYFACRLRRQQRRLLTAVVVVSAVTISCFQTVAAFHYYSKFALCHVRRNNPPKYYYYNDHDYSAATPLLHMTTDGNKVDRIVRLQNVEQERRLSWKEDWGWTYLDSSVGRPPVCSLSADDVVDDAFRAIAGTLYEQQQPDPAAVKAETDGHLDNNNSRSSSSSKRSSEKKPSLFAYRPQRSSPESGRIGIEIDGAEHLFDDLSKSRKYASRGQRRFALLLAMKLATGESWDEFVTDNDDDDDNDENGPPSSFRPVVLSFNTRYEALAARREMQHLQATSTLDNLNPQVVFDYIVIQTISDGLPPILHRQRGRGRYDRINKVQVDPTKGILLLCSPTDYSLEYQPPGPSLHTITDFQKTVATALLHATPTVVLSPRFSFDEAVLSSFGGGGGGGDGTIPQDAYQQAGYYGGKEPPRGTLPWVLRDFFPPSYCWIGDVLRSNDNEEEEEEVANLTASVVAAPRVVMSNSVMDKVSQSRRA
jgi:hypothetical protein